MSDININVELFDKICRVCLVQTTELKSLFSKLEDEDRSLLDLLSFTANIDIKLEDNLPKQICITCETSMCKANVFKQRCIDSETILNNIYRNATGYDETTNSAENISIKDDKNDLKQKLSEYGTFLSFVPVENSSKYEIDSKNSVLQEFLIYPTSDALDDIQMVKNEQTNKFEQNDHDFIDFDNGSQFETTEKPEENIETEKAPTVSENTKIGIRYQCYCEAIFTNKPEYKAHLKENKCNAVKVIKFGKDKDKLVKNRLYCQKCDALFKTVYAFKAHRRIHKNSDSNTNSTSLYECSFCLRKFKNKNYLEAHMQKHEESDNVKHVCEICKREFKYKAYLENHIATMHSKTKGFTCEVCIQTFADKETLDEHKKSHESEKKHRCTICHKGFYMLCTLKEHMRTHTGEKPFLCSQCGKGFSQKTNLAQHTRRHQGLKPFKCETCEKRFVSKGELDAHIRKHSGAHPFICDDCGNGFTTSSALVKHRRIHTGERPYQCDLCPMRFAASGTLKNHRRTHTDVSRKHYMGI